jgi:hypothetical protein
MMSPLMEDGVDGPKDHNSESDDDDGGQDGSNGRRYRPTSARRLGGSAHMSLRGGLG